ncbi:MAG: DUF1552 domain-containing protein [Planctomycetota bacterium]
MESDSIRCNAGVMGGDPGRRPIPVFGRSLSRRTFLRGLGAAVPLPWLDAMCPARRETPESPLRFVFVFAPNGQKMDEWQPEDSDGPLRLSPLLEPLSALRDRVLVLGNTMLDGARSHGDGPGDHARAAAAFLTAAHPKKTGGADIACGVSIDQRLARVLGPGTRLPSLELGMEAGRAAGVCDSGYSCAYSNNISWKAPDSPVSKEVSPRAAFSRLFGTDSKSESARALSPRERLGVLDAVAADAGRLRAVLGPADRARLEQYLDAVREVERRLQADAPPAPAAPAGLERGRLAADARLHLMYEIIALALQSDATRVVTFMLGNAGSNRSYPFLNVPEGHHELSHHRRAPDKLEKLRRINLFHVGALARFCQRLGSTETPAGNLLDSTVVMYGSGIADGNSHAHHDLPIVLVGGGQGRLHGGRHLRPPRPTPLANAYLTFLGWAGAEVERFGDSSGALAL